MLNMDMYNRTHFTYIYIFFKLCSLNNMSKTDTISGSFNTQIFLTTKNFLSLFLFVGRDSENQSVRVREVCMKKIFYK